jgi:hypothetical protein
MNKLRYPVRGQTYTYREIASLTLEDSPHLCFRHECQDGVIQTSHVTEEQLMNVPHMADSQWRYIRTTDELIPVFTFVGETDYPDIRKLCNLEQLRDYVTGEPVEGWWATPIGYPRNQTE